MGFQSVPNRCLKSGKRFEAGERPLKIQDGFEDNEAGEFWHE